MKRTPYFGLVGGWPWIVRVGIEVVGDWRGHGTVALAAAVAGRRIVGSVFVVEGE